KAHHRDSLLRARRDGPRNRRAAEQRDEVAARLPRNSIQKIPVESMTAVSSMRVRAAHGNSFDHLVGAGEERRRRWIQPLTILPRIIPMSACVNARMVCVRTFPRAPVLNPSAVMEISSGASTTETMSYSPSVQNTSFTVAPHFFAMALKASARFGVSLILWI